MWTEIANTLILARGAPVIVIRITGGKTNESTILSSKWYLHQLPSLANPRMRKSSAASLAARF